MTATPGRALVIAHDHLSPAGAVADALEARGHRVEVLTVVPAHRFDRPDVETVFPDPRDYDVVLPMGAPWAAYGDEVRSWVAPELDMLRQADTQGVPVLGICFGGQLLALAHGGEVGPSPAPEIGWAVVQSDDESLVSTGPWFQWHYDRWTVPPGATEVARNAAASQAFVLRRNLAVQFHPELDASALAGWLDNDGARLARERGLDPDVLMAHTTSLEQAGRMRAGALVNAFLDTAASAPPDHLDKDVRTRIVQP